MRGDKPSKKLSREEREETDLAMMSRENKLTSLKDLKIILKCKTEGQKELVNSIKSKEITICSGLAGTGKTYLACAQALKLLKSSPKKYQKIVLVKSVTTLKDEEIGFLKGGLEEKMEPFVYSFIHNFEKIIGKSQVSILKNADMISVMPIAYMRGINLDNSIVIIDEAQNISIDNIRTILTRLGSNSKMVFLGDQKQSDNKRGNVVNALDFMIDNFTDIEEMGLVRLGMDDVVRNPLIKKIEKKFEEISNN